MAPTHNDIEQVALALGELKERCFLAGGVSIPFYITDVLEEPPRVTEESNRKRRNLGVHIGNYTT